MAINQQQYASKPFISSGIVTTADASYTAPANATVGIVAVAKSSGARIDNLDVISLGTSVAGILRFWLCEGVPALAPVSSITSAAAVATMTSTAPHGLITGDLITIQDAFPVEYNVRAAAVTVTSATTFTFPITPVGGVSAVLVGEYSSTHAAPLYHLLKELPVVATTGAATTRAFNLELDSVANCDFMPLVLPAGWSIRTTVSVTQTSAIRAVARGGSF
jgi:hypothetical protein